MTAKSLTPYENDSAYLDHEFAWVKSHVAVMDCEKKLADSVADDADTTGHMIGKIKRVATSDLALRLIELREKEATTRSEIDERLELHRQSKAFALGLDLLCTSAALGTEERRIAIFLTLPAVNPLLASDVYAGIGYYGHALNVGEAIQLLRPVGVGDWLKCRRLFQITSSLVKHGIMSQDWPTKYAHPADLLNVTISLTPRAFAIITGEPDLVAEGAVPNDAEPS